jgi:hypothetical protein
MMMQVTFPNLCRGVLRCAVVCCAVLQKPKVKSTPWGSSYREAPEILHGYTSKVCCGDSMWVVHHSDHSTR